MAFKKVFSEPFANSINGSFEGYFLEPQRTVCSTIWATPVESSGGVLNPIQNTLFSSSLEMRASLAPLFLCLR